MNKSVTEAISLLKEGLRDKDRIGCPGWWAIRTLNLIANVEGRTEKTKDLSLAECREIYGPRLYQALAEAGQFAGKAGLAGGWVLEVKAVLENFEALV